MRPLFLGTHINKVDRKGRVSVPSVFRAVLGDQLQSGVALFPHLEKTCLIGGGADYLTEIAESLDSSFAMFSDEEENLVWNMLGASHQLMFDDGGRILLPRDLLDAAEITDQAAFVGMGKRFQIWQPELFNTRKAEGFEAARKNLSMLKRGSKGGE